MEMNDLESAMARGGVLPNYHQPSIVGGRLKSALSDATTIVSQPETSIDSSSEYQQFIHDILRLTCRRQKPASRSGLGLSSL